ncbi:hypothetical protein PGT21_007180 [Puccinia graminis f. sp. tritici]|uniref:Uncharacterized protein n=1 Tax=Puccinia graminis f. sp. tritici TaxID=56615 RepID=A0A5B0MQK6_PUCGR|nr:hypothetical protein PGT21_007180 [Puccinia graminis f. sp. tritici]
MTASGEIRAILILGAKTAACEPSWRHSALKNGQIHGNSARPQASRLWKTQNHHGKYNYH